MVWFRLHSDHGRTPYGWFLVTFALLWNIGVWTGVFTMMSAYFKSNQVSSWDEAACHVWEIKSRTLDHSNGGNQHGPSRANYVLGMSCSCGATIPNYKSGNLEEDWGNVRSVQQFRSFDSWPTSIESYEVRMPRATPALRVS